MPSVARVSGITIVEKTAEYAGGKAVQRTTRQKISQTWLASHTGPDRAVDEGPRPLAAFGPARGQIPEPGPEVGAAQQRVQQHAHAEHQDASVGGAHRVALGSGTGGGTPPEGPYGTSASLTSPLRQRLVMPRITRIAATARAV